MEWISVKDRLPEEHSHVLICLHDGYDNFIATSDFIEGEFQLWADSGDVTHWAILPEPPTQ
jgi:hypothetical protein